MRILLVSEFGHEDQNSTGHLVSLIPGLVQDAKVEVVDINSMPRLFGRLQQCVRRHRALRPLAPPVVLLGLLAGAMARRGRADVVIVGSNPPLSLLVPGRLWKVSANRLFYLAFDLFPETIGASDIRVPAALTAGLLRIRNRNFRRAEGVLVIGRDMEARVRTSASTHAVHYLPVWVSDERVRHPIPTDEQNLDPTLHFFGNMGRVIEFGPMLEMVRRNPRTRMKVFGTGPRANVIRDIGLENLEFCGPVAFSEREKAFSTNIVGVVPQSLGLVGLAVPSKAFYYWARGIPVLFVGSETSEIGRLIGEYPVLGRVVSPDEASADVTSLLAELTHPCRTAEILSVHRRFAAEARTSLRRALGLRA